MKKKRKKRGGVFQQLKTVSRPTFQWKLRNTIFTGRVRILGHERIHRSKLGKARKKNRMVVRKLI